MNCFWPQAVLYEMNVRQLTPEGTLRAATSKLPFLKDLGVDAVWLMPVYPIGEAGRKGSLGSYYSIRDYCAVNPELGTMADFDAFVAEAHRLGMRVLLDWVANHTARDARWIAEKPASWYERDAAGRPAVPWDWSDTAKLNYADRDVWRAQADAMEFWLTQHDVDGFRCDMAMLVPIEFWNETSLRLRRVKPDLFMLAEAEERNLFEEGAFDACYAWRMHHLMNDVARQRTRVTALRDYIYADRDDYPDSAMRLAFTSNHDECGTAPVFQIRCIASGVFTFVVPRGLSLSTGQEIGYDHSFAFLTGSDSPLRGQRFAGSPPLTALRHDNRRRREAGGAMLINNARTLMGGPGR
ncbi:MAG: alpha-amylase family glycosyl hydrolase [Alistipes shahii]|uniref:alpha-amylase family glycosyl hydrolase n=1 Tax=Alistipes shahii TaxID=328814 RepID=UPI00399C9E5E